MSILPLSLDSRQPKQVLGELRHTYGALKGIDNPGLDLNDRFATTQVEDMLPQTGRVSCQTHNAFGKGSLDGDFSTHRGRRQFLTVEQEGKQEVITTAEFPTRWSRKKDFTVIQLIPDGQGGDPLFRSLHIQPDGQFSARIQSRELSSTDPAYPAQKVDSILKKAQSIVDEGGQQRTLYPNHKWTA